MKKQVKVVKTKKAFYVEVKGTKIQTLSRRELGYLENRTVKGFLPPEITEKKGLVTLRYDAQGLLPLTEYLSMGTISKKEFLDIVRQFVLLEKELVSGYFSKSRVVYLASLVMIHPASHELYFLYVPLQPFTAEGSLRETLQDCIQYAVFDAADDTRYVQEYIRLVADENAFSLFLLEAFLDKHTPGNTPKAGRMCPRCKSLLSPGDSLCPLCGTAITPDGEISVATARVTEGAVVSACSTPRYIPAPAQEALSDSPKAVLLIRGAERIPLTQFPCRIGKQSECVNLVLNNPVVSRKHADILCEQGAYYVVDLGSTNGTFVDGHRIRPGERVMIEDGSAISFVNETYLFSIEEE